MLEGEISQIQLIERLVELWRERFTGAIRFENDGIIKIIYFKDGDILSASTNDRSDSIDEILMRAGKVSREHVKQALAKRKESESLGDALLNLGFITRKELTWARRVQVVGVIRSIAAWTDGSFTIVADYLPKRDEGTLFAVPQVLVELIVTEQDRTRFERALDGGEAVFEKTPDFGDVWRRLGLNEDAEAISNEIDGTKSATEVAAASNRDTFNVYKLLHALETLGVLTRAPKPQVQPQFSLDDFASAGVADAADLWNDPTPELPAAAQPELDFAGRSGFADPVLDVTPGDATPDEVQVSEFDMSPDDGPAIAFEPDDSPAYDFSSDAVDTPAPSAWDEPEETAVGGFASTPERPPARELEEGSVFDETSPMPGAPRPMPAWDTPPRDALSLPLQTAVEPPAEPAEEQWGFDEAQIETARRAAAVPPDAPIAAAPIAGRAADAPKRRQTPRRSRAGLLVALLAIAVLAGAGYFGFLWWQGREQGDETLVAETPVRPRRQPGAAPLATTPPPADTAAPAAGAPAVITPEAATSSAAATAATPGTSTAAAAAPAVVTPAPSAASPAPAVITPAAPTATAGAGAATPALPRVTARAGGADRERIDALAREFAANASGNYTVQIQILCDPGNVERTMRAGGERVWFVPQTLGGRSCYRVFWGRYGSREEAQRALAEAPAAIRDRSSAVKPVPR